MDYFAHYEKSPRMWSQGLHAHDYYEIYVHLEGGRLYCIDDIVYELKPNQLIVVPPYHMHGLVCDRDLVNYERCYLYLSTDMLERLGMGRIDITQYLSIAGNNEHIVTDISAEDAQFFKQSMRSIEEFNLILEKQLEIYAKILRILQLVSDNISHKTDSHKLKDTDSQIIEILHYINEHYTQDISIQSISSTFHISESSLSHRFREYVNKGVYEYILYKRIIRAEELMNVNDSLTDIAYQCGFSDYSNFLRVFKKITGLSPKDYRTQNKS